MSDFDGSTFNQARDGERLKRQLDIVRGIMADGQRHTLDELAKAADCSTASASARVRDLRKPKFGGLAIRRFYVSNGTWEYQISEAAPMGCAS